jgi:phosphomevalonate kinase
MPTVVSCPGKVLVAGGYLVLDRQHQGFVSATPSRFYTVVQNAGEAGASVERFSIAVVSPQFDDGRWEYEARREDGEWVVNAVEREGYVLSLCFVA